MTKSQKDWTCVDVCAFGCSFRIELHSTVSNPRNSSDWFIRFYYNDLDLQLEGKSDVPVTLFEDFVKKNIVDNFDEQCLGIEGVENPRSEQDIPSKIILIELLAAIVLAGIVYMTAKMSEELERQKLSSPITVELMRV
eukprot:TRINITY_DN9041_c0_g1_i1.p1 TRINITY_DN9041_c0_g1~~TRINITY_DN9041_c0_g1_i1.p1  ORF type:complete len:138 (-),score=18.36 TRINITY_DN9041_c0_g1_i1:46-459(-)